MDLFGGRAKLRCRYNINAVRDIFSLGFGCLVAGTFLLGRSES